MNRPVARSETLVDLFNKERLDPASAEIVAFALISERMVNVVDVDRASLGMDDAQQVRFLAGKIIPQYQPQFIPAGAKLTPATKYLGRRFKPEESLEAYDADRRRAEMLAEALDDDELKSCTALALIGAGPALGETRFTVVAKVAPAGVNPREVYSKPNMGTYDAPDPESAQAFLVSKTVTEPLYYIEIYTPEGGIGKDCERTYQVDEE